MEAMILACGERGYREISVDTVIDRVGLSRGDFQRRFESKEDCYAAAHAALLDRLCAELLEQAAAADGWGPGMRAALARLARFAIEQPVLARGLLIEVHAAGEAAAAQREQVIDRLARAIDTARLDPQCCHSPPSITGTFIVGAIESALVDALVAEQPRLFLEATPDLVYLAVVPYFGEAAGMREREAASSLG